VPGSRSGFPGDVKPPHAPWMTMAGACMLWVGWFGFNAGSALTAGTGAGMAMLVTHISAAVASLVWMTSEWTNFGKASLIGIVTGTIAGLATITPASGFVGPAGAVIIGLAGGGICYVCVSLVKQTLKIDDSLDVFAVHGVGGLTGILLAAFLASPSFGGGGLPEGQTMIGQFGVQLLGAAATFGWSLVASFVILKAIQMTIGLRVSNDDEIQGIDISAHGENAYNLSREI
jgi:Amt family ammonium transporter